MSAGAPLHLLVVDASRPDPLVYLDFAELAREAGFDVWYAAIDDLLDHPLEALGLPTFGMALFVVSSPLLQGLRAGTPPARAVEQAIASRWKAKAGITGLMLPWLSLAAGPERPLRALAPLLAAAGVDVEDDEGPAYSFLRYAADPLGRPTSAQPWDTTLLLPRAGAAAPDAELVLSTGTDPLGVLWRDPATGNHLLVGSGNALSFGSVSENFQILPMNVDRARELERSLLPALQRCARLLRERQPIAPAPRTIARRLALDPPRTTPLEIAPTIAPLRKVAWMETAFFEETWARAYQQTIVDYALRGRWDALWLSPSPNQYTSPIARFPDRAEKMWGGIAELCRLLRLESERRGVRPPELAVSFHPANNFTGANERAPRPARDLFGVDYLDVPAPLDRVFWEQEVIAPIATLAARWPSLSSGLPLGGVLLDLELYLRKLSGVSGFGPTMGFEPETVARLGEELGLGRGADLRRLLAERRVGPYYARLEAEAEALGRDLRGAITSASPSARVLAYGTTIHLDWFHAGLYRGLGTSERPLQLFTFASDGARHRPVLEARGLHVFHSSVLMQSKLATDDDFARVDQILAHNDGVWLNRLSRVEPYDPTKWHALEQSPLDADGRARFHDWIRAR